MSSELFIHGGRLILHNGVGVPLPATGSLPEINITEDDIKEIARQPFIKQNITAEGRWKPLSHRRPRWRMIRRAYKITGNADCELYMHLIKDGSITLDLPTDIKKSDIDRKGFGTSNFERSRTS